MSPLTSLASNNGCSFDSNGFELPTLLASAVLSLLTSTLKFVPYRKIFPFFLSSVESRTVDWATIVRDAGVRGGGAVPPQFLADQLTLFEPRGQIMPVILLPCPPIILDDAAFLLVFGF